MLRRIALVVSIALVLLSGCTQTPQPTESELCDFEANLEMALPDREANGNTDVFGTKLVDFYRAYPDYESPEGLSGPGVLDTIGRAWAETGYHSDWCPFCGRREGTDVDVALLVLYPDTAEADAAAERLAKWLADEAYLGECSTVVEYAEWFQERYWVGPMSTWQPEDGV
jgi:hypothetical protein